MADNNAQRIITIKELWDIFLRKLWLMILAAVLAVVSVLIWNILTFSPRYESTAMLYILQNDGVDKGTVQEHDNFNLALKVVNDCKYLIKSHSVLDTVIKDLNLNMSYKQLYKSVSITNPEDTRILQVSVESDTAYSAKRLVDAICTTATAKITETMGFEQVNFYEYGILNPTPCNAIGLKMYLIAGFLAAAVVYALCLVCFFMDDKIHTDEDMEKLLGLSILGDIPNFDASSKKRYGYYKKHKYYASKYAEEN